MSTPTTELKVHTMNLDGVKIQSERTIKELLQLMLVNQGYFSEGLCLWNSLLCNKGSITHEERIILHQYIRSNRPSKWLSINAYQYRNSPYYWTFDDIKPRIKWIKKHIRRNS